MSTYSYEFEQVQILLPERMEDSHKGTYGKLLIIAGSRNMCGASYFAAKAAYRCGTGLVYLYVPECNRVILQQMIPEAVLYTYAQKPEAEEIRRLLKGKTAAAIGPGIGTDPAWVPVLKEVISADLPCVFDADALNLLGMYPAIWKECKGSPILTPHMLEMSRLSHLDLTQILAEKENTALSFAKEHGAVVVLKDHHTLVTDGADLYRNQTGNHGMATGGSGDVLTGTIAAMLAQGLDSFSAAKAGVYMHGKAGDDAAAARGAVSVMASDIADFLFRGI